MSKKIYIIFETLFDDYLDQGDYYNNVKDMCFNTFEEAESYLLENNHTKMQIEEKRIYYLPLTFDERGDEIRGYCEIQELTLKG